MLYFITHVEPRHPQKGQEVLFFLREVGSEGNKSHVVVKEIPHYFYTPPLPREEAEYRFQQFREQPEFNHLNFEIKRYNQRRSFLRAEGSKEAVLPKPFLCRGSRDPLSLDSPTKLLRWLYPPGMLISSPQEIPLPADIQRRPSVPLEQLVADSYAVLDIEVEGWEFGRDHIFMAVYKSPQRQVLFHDLPFTADEQEGFTLIPFSSPQDLGKKLTATLQEEDPLWLFGHNIMNYDQIRIRDLTGEYFPAVNQHYPITKSSQGFGRVITKGRWTLDTYGYHFHYQNFQASNSLGTLSDLKVPLGHQEQARLVVAARKGSKDAFQELVHYCIGDAHASEDLGLKARKRVAQKMILFRSYPDTICSTSKRTIGREFWQRRHFIFKGTFADAWKWQREEAKFSLDEFKQYLLRPGLEPGLYDDVQVLYLTPFIAGARPLAERMSPTLVQCIQSSTNPQEKFDLLQTINAQLADLVEESLKVLDPSLLWSGTQREKARSYRKAKQLLLHPPERTEKQRIRLYCLFRYRGIHSIDPYPFLPGILSAVEKTNKFLEQHDLVNRGNYFHFVRRKVDVNELEESLSGCSLGRGKALCLRSGRTVADPFQAARTEQYVYEGFRPNSGEKTNFEKRLLQSLVRDIFSGRSFVVIKEYLDSELNDFCSGLKPREDYFLPMKARTYYTTVLGALLEERWRDSKSTITEEIVSAFQAIQKRITQKFSKETRKLLAQVVRQASTDAGYPHFQELWQEILQPYPLQINLAYAEGFPGRIPAGMADKLDLPRYKARVQRQFRDFYEILTPRQMKFGF